MIAVADPRRGAWVEVDLGAIATNVGVLAETVAPAALWVVVKADGYGHGAAAVARAALEAGAEGLCVAFVQEGAALRAVRDPGADPGAVRAAGGAAATSWSAGT